MEEKLDCLLVIHKNRKTKEIKTKCIKVGDEYKTNYKNKVYQRAFITSYYDNNDNKKYIVMEVNEW